MTSAEYKDIRESMEWCERKGFTSLAQFYRETIEWEARRGKLPPEAYPAMEDGDGSDR